MNDIVERLREAISNMDAPVENDLLREAADEIERLRKIEGEWMTLSQDEGKRDREIERLRQELKNLAPTGRYNGLDIEGWFQRAEHAEAVLDETRRQLAMVNADAAKAEAALATARKWLDENTTFYNVDADWPVEGHNIPALAQVSKRIWYHATDDETSYPFSAMLDRAISAGQITVGDSIANIAREVAPHPADPTTHSALAEKKE